MTERVDYHVNAYLQARGNFAKQMMRQSQAVGGAQRQLDALANRTQAVGRTIMGTTAASAAGYVRMGGAIAALGTGVVFAGAIRQGLAFNEVMEQTQNSIGAMFQLYKQNGGDMEANIAMAAHAQRQLFEMAKKSPVEFQDAVNIYQGAASGLIVANQSMQEQMEFMKGAQMLGAIVPDLPSQVIGGQVGRILLGGAGAEFEVWKRLAPSILEAGQAAGVFSKRMQIGQKFTQEFNKMAQATPEIAADLLKTSVEPLKAMQERFARSWQGILSTTVSNLKLVSAAFTGPFHEMRKRVLYELNQTGLFSEANLGRLEHVAATLGILFSDSMEWVFRKLTGWIAALRDNWDSILTTMYSVGQQVALLIKGAFFVGVARMAAGAATIAAGKGMAAAGAVARVAPGVRDFIGRRARGAHMGLGRGMAGRGRGLMGMMGGGMSKVFGRLETGSFRLFRGMDKLALKFVAMGTTAFALGTALAAVALALGAVLVVSAGIAAYVISNWDSISKSIVDGLESGKISLVPFLVAMYTFWERLKAVGAAFLGGTSGADMFVGAMRLGIQAFNIMSEAIAMTMKAIGISIGIWGALKLAFQGLLWVILQVIELIGKIPGALDESTVANARKNYEAFKASTQDTFTTVDQLLTKADQIADIDISALDMEEINKRAEEWKKKITETLKGEEKKKRKAKGPVVHVQNVVINQDLRDTDPDRLMAHFVKPLQRMADQRVQAYDQLDMGE